MAMIRTRNPALVRAFLPLLLLASAFGLPHLLLGATGPAWWTNPALTAGGNAPLIRGGADDYAAVNQGQFKNVAVTAVKYLDVELASLGGASADLRTLAGSLSAKSSATDDYSPVNLGQLKAAAKPFYDQLLAIGFAGPPLATGTYPWSSGQNATDDYAMANIGQLKHLFSFDLTYSNDGNPLPAWWRAYYFQTSNVNPSAKVSANGRKITCLQAWKRQIDPLPAPFFSPDSVLLFTPTRVKISAPGSTTILYTTDGSDPAVKGQPYSEPILVNRFEILRAIAYRGKAATQKAIAIYLLATAL